MRTKPCKNKLKETNKWLNWKKNEERIKKKAIKNEEKNWKPKKFILNFKG
jgi:hypothetical protein